MIQKDIPLTIKNNYMRYVFLFCILLTSCILSTWDSRVALVNGSSKKIRYIYLFSGKDDIRIDTTNCKQWDFNDIPPKSEQKLRSQVKIDTYFKQHPQNFLRIYIISEDSLQRYGSCGILEQQIFIKRYDLRFDDLERMKWRVEYNE